MAKRTQKTMTADNADRQELDRRAEDDLAQLLALDKAEQVGKLPPEDRRHEEALEAAAASAKVAELSDAGATFYRDNAVTPAEKLNQHS